MSTNPHSHNPIEDPAAITAVWSAFGHTFISEDELETCLVCGANYQLVADDPSDPTHGRYCAANGDDPMQCSGDTSMAHGYPGEREDGNGEHHCNCIRCT